MTKDTVKKKMKAKFGTYKNFADAAELDMYEFQTKFLNAHKITKADLKKMQELCDNTDVAFKGPITDEQRDALRGSMDDAGGVMSFASMNSRFSASSIFGILNGTRKLFTPAVKELFDHLKIK